MKEELSVLNPTSSQQKPYNPPPPKSIMGSGRIIIGILFIANVYAIFAFSLTEIQLVSLGILAAILGILWFIAGKPKRKLQYAH